MLLPLLLSLVAQSPDTARLVIVATTDVHGRATGWDYVTDAPHPGGIARAGTIIDSLRRVHPGQVVVVDAGDLIQGDPFGAYFGQVDDRSPHPVIEAMNLAGYDVATPGNHEFNFGLEVMRRAIASARFHYVSGNIVQLPRRRLELPSSVVLERHGVRIGVTGFTTPGVMVWDRENVRDRVRVLPIIPAARPIIRDLNRRTDFTLVVIHSGMDGTSSFNETGVGPENVAAQFANLPDRPDLVVVGHSHRQITDSVINGVRFMQARPYAQSLAVMHVELVRRGRHWEVISQRGEQIPLAVVPVHPRIESALAEAHELVRKWNTAPLAEVSGAMSAATARMEPTAIINWVNEVQRQRAGTELSSTAPFDTRAAFGPGPVRLAHLAQLYPYENTLRAIRISGADLRAYLEQSARYFSVNAAGQASFSDTIPGYNYDIVWGADYTIDLSRPPGQRITSLSVRDRPVVDSDTFSLALNNYRQGGGGGFGMLADAPVIYDQNENVRDLLVEDATRRGVLNPAEFERAHWRLAPAEMAEDLRRQALAAARPAGAPRDSTLLRVFTTNDFHGAVEPRVHAWSNGRPIGGAAALAGWMDSSATACACPTMRLDGGDQMQGTLQSNLVFGRSVVESFNALKLDAAVIGNHDLDWGQDTLRARIAESRYTWLAANMFDSTTGRRPDWVRPWTMMERGGLRVALVGYMIPSTRQIVKPEFVQGLTFRSGRAAIEDVLTEVRAARPDLTILLAHEGAFCDAGTECRGEVLDLARELDSMVVQLIASGHTHSLVNTTVNGITIIQARSSGTAVGVADLVQAADGTRRWRVSVETLYADGVSDPAVEAMLDTFRPAVAAIANQPVATLTAPLPREGAQYPLGNMVADALRIGGRAQVGFINTTGIRAPLPAGIVTYEQVFLVHPFGNRVVRVTLTGAQLREMIEHSFRAEGGEGPNAHVSGLVVEYDMERPRGSRVTTLRTQRGQAIRPGTRYTVAVPDYLAQGGSGYTMLVGAPQVDGGRVDVDNLVQYLRQLPQPVAPPTEIRMRPVRRP
ncbi:MAG TPA: 5'-nucleotidase C-terminal domain-containing protein [Gemmatimonadales bacterium]|nr:5'-nucleotidase C-terminal domain-containing protein [Gemmatimonadales bacterium]